MARYGAIGAAALRMRACRVENTKTNTRLSSSSFVGLDPQFMQHLGSASFTTVDLVAAPVLPKAFRSRHRRTTLAGSFHGSGGFPSDNVAALDFVTLGLPEIGRGLSTLQHVRFRPVGHIEDQLLHSRRMRDRDLLVDGLRFGRQRRDFHHPKLGHAVLDVLEIAADAVLSASVFFSPAQEVSSGPRRVDAPFLQLTRGEGEEFVPGLQFARVFRHLPSNQGEEGRDVGHKRYGFRDLPILG